MKTRLQTALGNLRTVAQWRPRDYSNFVNMLLRMPRPLRNEEGMSLRPAQIALTMFTRMELSYEPRTLPTPGAEEQAHRASQHLQEPTVALFVDAPEHLSGVSLTLRSWADEARKVGMPFFLHMAGASGGIPGAKSFPHVGTLRLSSYPGLDVPVPDVRTVTRYMRGHPFDVAHLSTPGPMGLLGMRIAQGIGAPICGTYHTDLPRYVGLLTGSAELEAFTWEFMRWFYGQMDLVAAPSEATRQDLIAHGLDGRRIRVVGRGVETDQFSPSYRSQVLRKDWGASDRPVLLYVGRVSREKNLPLLVEAYRQLRSDAVLVVVGEGPYLDEMRTALHGTPAVFTGTLRGDDLSRAFASGDLFVFPSQTDTFGRVLIEAQASGLPVLVSDQGGPRDTVAAGKTGWVVPDLTASRFAAEVDRVLSNPASLREAGRRARHHALRFTPQASFDAFWNLHRHALNPHHQESHANRPR